MVTKIIFQALLILIAINGGVAMNLSTVMETSVLSNASASLTQLYPSANVSNATNGQSNQFMSSSVTNAESSTLLNVHPTATASMSGSIGNVHPTATASMSGSIGNVHPTTTSSMQLQASSNANGGSNGQSTSNVQPTGSMQLQPSSTAGGNGQSDANGATTNVHPTTATAGGQSKETVKQESNATKTVVPSPTAENIPASSSVVPKKRHECDQCDYNTNMDKDKQICNKTLKECGSDEDRCIDYHIINGTTNGVEFHGKDCAKWENQCNNTAKFCEDYKKDKNLVPSSECDIVCCTGRTDCSKGYSVVRAANSAIILLFAPFVLVSSFI